MEKENNKLIAEFMEVPQGKHFHYDIEPFNLTEYSDVEDLKYDISWDWLQSAVTECHKIIENYGYDDDTRNYIDDEIFNLDNTLSEYFNDDKDAIYNRVVKFINFYNQNK